MQNSVSRWRIALPVIVFLVANALGVASLRAQQGASGEIQGAVVDPRGQGVPSAAVVVKSASLGETRTTSTDGEGRFSVKGLPAGNYTVEVEAPGA